MINIEEVISNAINMKASDIHIIEKVPPVFRINRVLTTLNYTNANTKEDIFEIFDFLINNNEELKNIYQKTRRLDFNYNFHGTRLRVNISSSNGIPVITTRIVNKELPKFKDLGLPDIVMREALLPQGLILVTGKSNSGKSTTLNAIVNEINQIESKKILMLENPVEFMHVPKKSLIVQKEVGPGKDCNSFSEGTINALREDCDILVIGEIRDRITMDAALEMAEAGHLVIGTMHTKSCAETIDRAFNFFDLSDQLAVKYMLSSLLKVVVSQRLINTVSGRLMMIPEIMVVDDVVASIIRKEKFTRSEIDDAIQTRFDKGNISFVNSLANAINSGLISLDQAKKQLDDKDFDTLNRVLRQSQDKRNLR